MELFNGDREHLMQEGLCYDISLKPFRGGRKVAVIDDADYEKLRTVRDVLDYLRRRPPVIDRGSKPRMIECVSPLLRCSRGC